MRNYRDEVLAVCDYLDPAGWYPRPYVLDGVRLDGVSGCFMTEDNTIFINWLIPNRELVSIIAHEVRHWWQFHSKWLAVDGDNWVWWKGEQHTHYSQVELLAKTGTTEDYFRLPWERDAEDFANEYLGHLAKTLAA